MPTHPTEWIVRISWQQGKDMTQETHYSDAIEAELAKLGWEREDKLLFKTFKGVAPAGQLSNGDRIVYANWCVRRRYLELTAGFAVAFDLDMRDRAGNPAKAAKEFDDKAHTAAKGE